MTDLIDRQAAIKAIEALQDCYNGFSDTYDKACIIGVLEELPSAQHFCRECKWVKYQGSVDKYGNVESYWRCCNWDGETDEEGFCHEWEGTQ